MKSSIPSWGSPCFVFPSLRQAVRGWFVGVALIAVGMAIVPERALAQRPLGIDVSSYQGSGINWSSVKSSGRVFAWTKATEGTGYIDADFTINENNGKAAGVYIGAYHSAPPELNTPAAEASYFWNEAGGYIAADGLTLMPMLDVEGSAFSGNVGASSLSDWINQWCTDVVQDAANNGVTIKPVIYISACNACYLNSTVTEWGSGIANYGATDGDNDPQNGTPWSSCSGCDVWGGWNFWQYASKAPDGSVSGVSGACDVDVFNGTLSSLQSSMLATTSSSSKIYYWDPQGTSGANPYTGSMTGTWENNDWAYGSAGQASLVGWTDGKAACFGVHTGKGTPAYTVTMNSSHVVAGFFDGALAPNSCDITIQGSGIIDLASGAQALDAANSSDGSAAYLRINCVIAGNGQLFPEGNGQSFLHGANTYTGGTQLGYHDATPATVAFNGIVNFNNGSAFGTGPITLWNYGNGGALVLEGTTAVTITNAVSVASATTNNIVGNAAGLTFSGNWTTGGNLLTLGTGATAGNQTIISGVVSGTAGLTLYNSGTLVLSGINTYSGTTSINSPAVLTIGGAGKLGNGSYAGSIVNNGTFNYNSTASQTLSGVISGSGPLKQNNAGLLALTGVNTYSGGTTVSSGATLGIAADSALGASTAGLTLNGGCLKNNNSAPTVTSSRTITLGAGGGYLDAGWAPSDPLTINAKLTGSGQLLINQDGSPVVLANTANNYTGNTIIGVNGPGYYAPGTAAWLKLGASNVLPNGAGYGDVCISNAWNGRLDLAGYSDTINGLWGDGLITNTAASASTLTVGGNNVTSTFAGTIETSSGSIALTKTGTGVLILNGANTYSGGTTVNGGTLIAQSTGALGTGNATVANGAVLQLANVAAMGSGANLILNATTPSAGTVNLAFTGTQTINALYFGSTQKATGTWAASGATHNNAAFTGSGILNVITGPASGTGVSLTSGSNPSTYGSSLTFTATVTGNSPGGTVQFLIDGIAAGSPVTLAGGSASFTTSALTVSGSPHQVTASYGGDDNNNPSSTASALSQAVMGAATVTALTSSQNPSAAGSNVTFTATVSSGAGTLTGNVVFLANAVPFSTNALVGGVVAASTAALPSGTNTIAAQYAAQSNYLGSTNSLQQVVQSLVVCSQTNAIVGISLNQDGTFTLTFIGTPQAQYYLVASPDASASVTNWVPLAGSTNTVTNSTGLWQLIVTNTFSQQYYRSTAVVPCQ